MCRDRQLDRAEAKIVARPPTRKRKGRPPSKPAGKLGDVARAWDVNARWPPRLRLVRPSARKGARLHRGPRGVSFPVPTVALRGSRKSRAAQTALRSWSLFLRRRE